MRKEEWLWVIIILVFIIAGGLRQKQVQEFLFNIRGSLFLSQAEPEGIKLEPIELIEKLEQVQTPEEKIAGEESQPLLPAQQEIESQPPQKEEKLSLSEIQTQVNEISEKVEQISQKVAELKTEEAKLVSIQEKINEISQQIEIISQQVTQLNLTAAGV